MWVNIVCTVDRSHRTPLHHRRRRALLGRRSTTSKRPATRGGGAGSGITFALVMQGAVLTFFSFIGFEDILNVSEEVKNPSRNVPFGLIGAMILATCIYMAVAITAVSVVPWQELAQSEGPLMEVAQPRRAVVLRHQGRLRLHHHLRHRQHRAAELPHGLTPALRHEPPGPAARRPRPRPRRSAARRTSPSSCSSGSSPASSSAAV